MEILLGDLSEVHMNWRVSEQAKDDLDALPDDAEQNMRLLFIEKQVAIKIRGVNGRFRYGTAR